MKRDQVPAHLRSSIRYHVIVDQDPSFEICANNVIFQNQGNTRVIIDGHFVLDPEETLEFSELAGRFIVHKFHVNFATLASPPTADSPRIYSGNRLLTTIIEPEILPS